MHIGVSGDQIMESQRAIKIFLYIRDVYPVVDKRPGPVVAQHGIQKGQRKISANSDRQYSECSLGWAGIVAVGGGGSVR